MLYLVSRSGNRLGANWLQKVVGNEFKVHLTEGIYGGSHIDSTIMALRPGLVLLNGSRVNKNNCPKIFKKWKKIYFKDIVKTPKHITEFHNKVRKKNYNILKKRGLITDINHMASAWIGMNFLSLDKNTIVIDQIQTNLIKLLEKLKFNVIPIKFSNSYYLKSLVSYRGKLKFFFIFFEFTFPTFVVNAYLTLYFLRIFIVLEL